MKQYEISIITKVKEKRAVGEELLKGIRAVDRKEMEGMGVDPRKGVMWSVAQTVPIYVARDTETKKLIAVWGLQFLIGQEQNTYIIWCLGTDEINHVKKSFIEESRKYIDRWLGYYGELKNTVACFNHASIRWLKWMGAEFGEPYKINGNDYMDFVIRRQEENV